MTDFFHTRLYSDSAYDVISFCKKLRYYSQNLWSLDRQRTEFVRHTRKTNAGIDWTVYRAPDGEVLVAHTSTDYEYSETVKKMKGELKDAIACLSIIFGEDERFVVIPYKVNRFDTVIDESLIHKMMKRSCIEAVNGIRSPRNFMFERADVDYVFSNPLSIRKIRECMDVLGDTSNPSPFNPFDIERRKMLMSAIISFKNWLDEVQNHPKDDKEQMLRKISIDYYKHLYECGVNYSVFFLASVMSAATMFPDVEEDALKWALEDYRIEENVLADFFNSDRWKELKIVLEMCRDEKQFPSPILLLSCGMHVSYKKLLGI